jgi:hypothetical protein
MTMWRLYVGGLLMGIAIGGFLFWLAAWSIVPESARNDFAMYPLLLLPFALAGENLRIKSKKNAEPVAAS